MRGAATAAQVAMRNTYGRSQTPDVLLAETRPSARRSGAHELREDTAEPASLIVKLRITPARFKQWVARRRFGRTGAPPLSGFPTSQSVPVKASTPQPAASSTTMPPPTTPNMSKQSLPTSKSAETPLAKVELADESSDAPDVPQAQESGKYSYDKLGRIEASVTPARGDAEVSYQPPLQQ